ncbi:hypothetical protein OPQ81_002820 [Rhizoctonia solani]|nr:hypothetical protein OPQ81_002820 [Rhizoctonia solani]
MQSELNRIEREIEQLTLTLSQTPHDDPNTPTLLTCLGDCHDDRFDLLGELNDIDKAIKYATITRTLTPDDDPDLPRLLSNLGGFHCERFQRLHEMNDCNMAMKYISLAVDLTPTTHPAFPARLAKLGESHNQRFQHVGELRDLEKGLECVSRAVALTPEDDPEFPYRVAHLGTCHRYRYERLGELIDLEKAVEYESRALLLTPDDHPDFLNLLTSLAMSLKHRFNRLGELGDLEKAIECESRALALTPDGRPHLSNLLSSLGGSHGYRYGRLGDLADLEKAIEYGSRAVALTPDDHPELSARVANLGISHGYRYERLSEPIDLERAIDYGSRAVSLIPDGHPDLPSRLVSLGSSLGIRFRGLGELGDLDKAIEHESRALELTPDGHRDLSERLNNLGVSLKIRFQHLGELGDLEKAIEYESRALALTPDGHSRLQNRLSNLGTSLQYRFNILYELSDLEKAIEYKSRALDLVPDGHSDLPSQLTNLATALLDRFKSLGKLDDLEKAIEYESRALAVTPNGCPPFPENLYNLGISHSLRFVRLSDQEDLKIAIKYMSCALESTPDGHPNLPHEHFPLAVSRLYQYQCTGDPSQLHKSLASFRMASKSLAGPPRHKFRYAVKWARLASKESHLNCLEAYQTTIDLLPQFIWLGATTTQRYHDLEQAQNVAVSAGYAALLSSEYALALEWLEHARCVVWNQYLMLRSPLDQLITCDPGLATRLQTVAARLHHAGSRSRESQVLSSGSFSPEQVAQKHHQLAQEYDDLIAHTRALPGFEDFLRPIKASSLVHAARNGPIVVINCDEDHCDALVIMPGQDKVRHTPLPNFTGNNAQVSRLEMASLVRDSQSMERGVERRPVLEDRVEFQSVLAVLWYNVVKPVLDFLGYTKNTSNNSLPLPHITWCPTGALSFLPLHAAGDYDQPQSRVFDYVISSYTPTLTALLSSTPSSLTPDSRVLAIGQPNTPGHSSLPGTAQELAYLKDHMSGKVEYSQLMDDQATTTAVLDAMEQHDWVHLACHAHQNVQDPTKSGFFLHDDILDLASINQRSFKGKGLAYLSACQTATGDKTLPDEAIHLASGMLMAGYSSVIATMWSVMDDDAPFVADKVYSQLMRDGTLGRGEAGKALHYAVAELREKVGEREFGRWVPYIHIGS